MKYVCDKCGRGVDYGHNVSHAKNRTRRLRLPNLHHAKVVLEGKVVRQRLCTKCLRMAERAVDISQFQAGHAKATV